MKYQACAIADYIVRRARGRTMSVRTLMTLTYLAYAVSVDEGRPLCADTATAGEHGPVFRSVRDVFGPDRSYARPATGQPALNAGARRAVDRALDKFGRLTAFDLTRHVCRPGGAWAATRRDRTIVPHAIRQCHDGRPSQARTLAAGLDRAAASWPNAMRMLAGS